MKCYALLYLLGGLIATSLLVFWFFTGLPMHLTKILTFNQQKTPFDDWAGWLEWLKQKSPLLGELCGCPVCFSFWASLFTSVTIMAVNHLSFWFIPSAALSWPTMAYVIFRILSK